MNRHILSGLFCAVLLAASCGGSDHASTTIAVSPEVAARYGYGPGPDAKLQPDVVVIEGGPNAIRSASANGLTWTIDGHAGGASDLAVGKVMFASASAVGRVAALHDEGDNRVVTLAPVELGEVVRDGEIDVDQALDPAALSFQAIPEMPGVISKPTPEDLDGAIVPARASSAPQIELASAVPWRAEGLLPPPTKAGIAIPFGNGFEAKPFFEREQGANEYRVGLELTRDNGGGIRAGIVFGILVEDLHIRSTTIIRDGEAAQSGFVIDGIKGFDVSISAGAENGALDNAQLSLEVPVEVNYPMAPRPPLWVPLNIKLQFKMVIATAFSGNNSTLFASGKYGLLGPIGRDDSGVVLPTFIVKQSMIDSIKGISLGPAGITTSMRLRVLTGLGTPSATAGPYGSLLVSVSVANGSALGLITQCKGGTLEVKTGLGVGLVVAQSTLDALRDVLPGLRKMNAGVETTRTVVRRSQVVPDIPLCKPGS